MSVRKATIGLLASALLGVAPPFARADIKLGQERFFGRGSRGPYAISRVAVEPRTEVVRLNGRHLIKGQDYQFDPSTGTLAFTESVMLSDIVDIDYSYDTQKAHAPTGLGGTMGLINAGSGGLALNYTFKPDAGGNQTLANLGFTGQAMLGNSAISSTFMVDKTAGAAAGRDAQNTQLSMKQEKGRFQYDLAYSRVGLKFGQADALKLVKGSEALNFAGSLQLAQNSALTFTKNQTSTPDAKTGVLKDVSTENAGLGMNLAPGTRFTALHEKQSEEQGKSSKSSTVDRLQLDQTLGSKASASLVNETVTTGKDGSSETVKGTRLNAVASGDHGLKFETAMSMTDSSKAGSAREIGMKLAQGDGATKVAFAVNDRRADSGDLRTHALSIDSAAARGLHFVAGLSGETGSAGSHERTSLALDGGTSDALRFAMALSNDTGASKHGMGRKFSLSSVQKALKFSASSSTDDTVGNGLSSTKINLETPDKKNMKLVASHAADKTEKGETDSTKVNFDAGSDNVKVAMAYTDEDNGKVAKQASGVNIVATPSDSMKLTANVGEKNDEKGSAQSRGVGVEANPNGGLSMAVSHAETTEAAGQTDANKLSLIMGSKTNKLTGSYSDNMTPTGASSIKQATINLTPIKDKLIVAGAFSDEIKQNNTQIQIAMLQADVHPTEALAVTTYYKQRDTGAADQINTMNASVTLKPSKAMQMVGTYSANPEEKDQVLRLVRKGLALQTQMGGLTFSGGYLQESSLVDDSEGTRAEFKLGLQLSKTSNLSGAYEQTIGSVKGYKPVLSYNVKYNHDMGADFHLLLDGSVVKRDDSVPVAQRDEVKATASLGVRF